MSHQTHPAPWGKTLWWVSALSCAICVAASFAPCYIGGSHHWSRWLVLPLLLPPSAALFIIRSYTIAPGTLIIRRLLWNTRLPLAGLQSAIPQANAMRRSIRLCGNGGMLSFTGWYRNSALGNYRAFVTDLNRTVVLRFTARTVIVSPEQPEAFAAELENSRITNS